MSRYCSVKCAPHPRVRRVSWPRYSSTVYLVNVNSGIIERVLKHEHEVGRRLTTRRLIPGVSTGEAIAGSDDQLCGASGANAIDGCLVVCEDEAGVHAGYSRVSSSAILSTRTGSRDDSLVRLVVNTKAKLLYEYKVFSSAFW